MKIYRCLLLALLGLAAAAPLAATGETPQANHRWLEVGITDAGLQAMRQGALRLPQLRAYDADGQQLLDRTGFSTETFGDTLAGVLRERTPNGADQQLADELAELRDADGQPLGELPAAEVTLVKYWAEWCLPCHAQSKALAKVLDEFPDRVINVVHVEAAPTGGEGAEKKTVVKLGPGDINPIVAAALRDPSLTAEERQELLRKVAANVAAAAEEQDAAAKAEPAPEKID